MRRFDATKVFRRKDDNIALDFEGKRHYYPIEHVEFGFMEYVFNTGLMIVPGTETVPERIQALTPKYHNILIDAMVAVRGQRISFATPPIPVNEVIERSCKIRLHEPEAQPRRYVPWGNAEAFMADHISSPYDDPDETSARVYFMFNDEPAFIAQNNTDVTDPPGFNIRQLVKFLWAIYLLGNEIDKPAVYTPIPYIRTTIADFAARRAKVSSPTP